MDETLRPNNLAKTIFLIYKALITALHGWLQRLCIRDLAKCWTRVNKRFPINCISLSFLSQLNKLHNVVQDRLLVSRTHGQWNMILRKLGNKKVTSTDRQLSLLLYLLQCLVYLFKGKNVNKIKV